MKGYMPDLVGTRARMRELDPDLSALKPGEGSDEAQVFRCEHCKKLRHYDEGCDTGHPFVKDKHEDAFLRSVCDYCWGAIVAVIEELHDKARRNRAIALIKEACSIAEKSVKHTEDQ